MTVVSVFLVLCNSKPDINQNPKPDTNRNPKTKTSAHSTAVPYPYVHKEHILIFVFSPQFGFYKINTIYSRLSIAIERGSRSNAMMLETREGG